MAVNSETGTVGFQECETAIALPKDAIADFCKRWMIDELYLFGSVLREDFREDSDVDVLITFAPNNSWGWEIVSMKDELEKMLSRKVDFLTKKSIEESDNWIRRKEIIESARLIYAAR